MVMSLENSQPKAILWNRVFCWSMALTNIALTFGIIWAIQNLDWLFSLLLVDVPSDIPEYEIAKSVFLKTLVMACISGAIFAPLNIWLAHARESSTMYHIHLCNLLVGLTTCVCLPIALPLLISWLKPEVKKHFGVDTSKPTRSGR